MSSPAVRFAVLAAVRHAAHHAGDHWLQTDHQAVAKGEAARDGKLACAAHVAGYTATHLVAVAAANRVFRLSLTTRGIVLGEPVSAATHYTAARREHGLLPRAARRLGKGGFLDREGAPLLDQAWHHEANLQGRTVGGSVLLGDQWATDQPAPVHIGGKSAGQ